MSEYTYSMRPLKCHPTCVEIDGIVRVEHGTRRGAPHPNRGQVECTLCKAILRLHPEGLTNLYAHLFTYALNHAKQHRDGAVPTPAMVGALGATLTPARAKRSADGIHPDDD